MILTYMIRADAKITCRSIPTSNIYLYPDWFIFVEGERTISLLMECDFTILTPHTISGTVIIAVWLGLEPLVQFFLNI